MTTAEEVREACEAVPLAYERREEAIRKMSDEGATLREIAAATGGRLTHMAVHKILAKSSSPS